MKKILLMFIIFTFLFTFKSYAEEESTSQEKDTTTPLEEIKKDDNVGLITNEFSVFYQNDYKIMGNDKITVTGWHKNQLKASGQLLFNTYLIKGAIIGSRYDFKLDRFSYNPVFSVDSFNGEAGAGYIWKITDKIEICAGLNYLYYNYKPNNKDEESSLSIPYTNSYLDFEHTRHGLGLDFLFYWQPLDYLALTFEGTGYPFLFSVSQEESEYIQAFKSNISLRYMVIPGFTLSAFYSNCLWFGSDISEMDNILGLGLTLSPNRIKEE